MSILRLATLKRKVHAACGQVATLIFLSCNVTAQNAVFLLPAPMRGRGAMAEDAASDGVVLGLDTAWAVGLIADDAARVVAWLVGGGLIVLLGVETAALVTAA